MLIGLVGKPSVGKSTFFKSATLAEVEIAPYPFTTIKPNHGVGYVRVNCIDKEFKTQCTPSHGFCINHKRFVPIELLDVAGLVPGASEGKGLGNKFLDDLRQADALVHIVDASGGTDSEGKFVNDYDVCEDIIFLEEELNEWFYNILMRAWKTFSKEINRDNCSKVIVKKFSGLKINETQVKKVLANLNFLSSPREWKKKELKEFSSELRKISKKMIIIANKIDTIKGEKNYLKLKKILNLNL